MPYQLPCMDDLTNPRFPSLEGFNATPKITTTISDTNTSTARNTATYNQLQVQQSQLVMPEILSTATNLSDTLSSQIVAPSLRDYVSTSTITTSATTATGDSTFDKAPTMTDSPLGEITPVGSPSDKSTEKADNLVKLARRRVNRAKTKTIKKNVKISRPQGRPLSKESRVRLTLVPTLEILYSILVSDTMKKKLSVLKYENEKDSIHKTNEQMSTKNVISGFSSLLNVQTVRFLDEPNVSPNRNSGIPEYNTIDEAAFSLFGVSEYSLIRVTRAAATEVGGSVLLKIETAMPGHLFLNDDEDEDFNVVESKKDFYQESIGSIGDRPTTSFLKKRVARPRYKSDMRIYLIPRSVSCAIYCETRMFKRDLLRGFLDMNNLDRSVIIAFEYSDLLKELEEEGHSDLITKYSLPSLDEAKALEQEIQFSARHSSLSQPQPPQPFQQSYVLNTGPTYGQKAGSLSPQPYLVQGSFLPSGQIQQFDPSAQRYSPYSQHPGQFNVGSIGYPQTQLKQTYQIPTYPQSGVQQQQQQQQQQVGYQPFYYSNVYDPQVLPNQGVNSVISQPSHPVSAQPSGYPTMETLSSVGQQSPADPNRRYTEVGTQYGQQTGAQFYSPNFNVGQSQYIYRDPKGQGMPFNNGYQPM